MKKITGILIIFAICFALTACFSANAPSTPDEPRIPPESEPIGKATVTVCTPSGKPLSDVFVFLYDKSGAVVGYGETNLSGQAEFNLSGSEYTVKLEELPVGYVAPDSYILNSSELRITAKTQLIPENQGFDSYRVGDVMQDFTFTDCQGNQTKLSDLLNEKEAVVLNFWFVNCSFCTKEFPYLNEAYGRYSDRIEILGINMIGESDTDISNYKNKNSIDIPMGRDNCEIAGKLGFSSAPATVIINSDGIVVFSHVGAITTTDEWCELFDAYLG